MAKQNLTGQPASSTAAAEFAESIGRAILAWQDVELRCAHLYVWLLDARNANGALSSFRAVHALSLRALMLKSAARHMFQLPDFEDLSDEFDGLMDALNACSRVRNRLTHSEISEEVTETGWAFTLKTPAVETDNGGVRAKLPPLDVTAIRAAEGELRALADGLHALEEQLRERLESL